MFLAHPQDHCHQQPRSAFSSQYGGSLFHLPELGFSFGQGAGVGPGEPEQVRVFLSSQEAQDSCHDQHHLVASHHFSASVLGYLLMWQYRCFLRLLKNVPL